MAGDTDSKRWQAFPWLRPFLVAVLLVAVPAVLYWWFYVGEQSREWQRRARTRLDAAAESMTREMELRAPLRGVDDQDCAEKRPIFKVAGSQLEVVAERGEKKCARKTFDLAQIVPWSIATGSFDYVLLVDGEDHAVVLDASLARRADADFFDRKDGERFLRTEAAPANSAKPDNYRLASLKRVKAPDAEYAVFRTTIDLPVDVDGTEKSGALQLVGLVAIDRIQAEALALSPVALVRIGALVATVFLVLPYLKIRFMGRRERLRASDLWLLGTAALLASAAATLFIVHSYGLARSQARADAELRAFAEQVSQHFKTEIDRAAEELAHSAPLLETQPIVLCGRILASHPDCSPGGASPADPQRYPFFEAIGIASEERQLRKWMPRSPPTDLVSVAEYSWPRAAMDLPESAGSRVIDHLFASTSGLGLLVLALPAGNVSGKLEVGAQIPDDKRTSVAFIGLEPLSLRAPAVPYPFAFAAVDRDGQVAFRSGPEGWPGENLLDGFDDREAIRHTLARQIPTDPADHRYLGRMHRVSTVPLADSSLTLVSYYDKRATEELSTLAIVSGLSWLAMLVVVIASAVAVLLIVEKRALEWIWPSACRTPSYLAGAAAFVILGVAFVIFRALAPEKAIPHLLLLAPAVALALMSTRPAGAMARWIDERPIAGRLSARWYPRAYKMFATSGLLTLVALPIALASWDAISAGDELFESYARSENSDRAKRYERGLSGLFVFERETPAPARTAADSQQTSPLPQQPDAGTETQSRAGRPDSIVARAGYEDPMRALATELGVYTKTETREVAGRKSAASGCSAIFPGSVAELPAKHFSLLGLWCWGSLFGVPPRWSASAALLAASREEPPAVGAGPATTTPSAGDVSEWKPRVVWLALPILLFVVFVWRFVSSVAQRILGLELEGDGIIDRSADVSDRGPRHWLLLRPDAAALAAIQPRLSSALHTVDLRDATLTPESIAAASLPANRTVMILNLERRLGDVAWRDALFELICMPRSERLLLVAAIDPLYYLVTRAQSGQTGAADWSEIQRWSAALQRVERARFKLPLGAASSVAKHPQDVLLSKKLAAECGWSERLREIETGLRNRGPALYQLLWPEIVDYVLDAAEPYYREIWCLCTQEEQLVLRQLAEEGFVNPRGFAVLRRLRRRRLVRIDPRVRLACESFRQFVLEAEDPETVRAWEADGESSSRVRGPLLAVGFVIATLFLLTLGPQVGDAVALAGASGTLITAVAAVWANARRGALPS